MGEREMTMRVLYICCQIAVLLSQQLSNILIIIVDESTVLQSVFFLVYITNKASKQFQFPEKLGKLRQENL